MSSDGTFPLNQLPAQGVPDLWASYCALYGSNADALVSLNHPGTNWLETHASVDRDAGRGDSALNDELIEKGTLSRQITSAVRDRLSAGEFIATGMQPPSLERAAIPAELWADLEFNFPANSAKNKHYEFTHITVRNARVGPAGAVTECIDWLKTQPKKLKKVMHGEALARLPDLRVREFNQAYQKVFGTTRGRPRKIDKK